MSEERTSITGEAVADIGARMGAELAARGIQGEQAERILRAASEGFAAGMAEAPTSQNFEVEPDPRRTVTEYGTITGRTVEANAKRKRRWLG